MPKANKRDLILQALERLLPGRRLYEITMDEVAREAQIGKGTIYLYFKDKGSLCAALSGYCMSELCSKLKVLETAEPAARPARAVSIITRFLKHHYSWFSAMNDFISEFAKLPPEERQNFAANQHNAVDVLANLLAPLLPADRQSQACDCARLLFWIVQGEVQTEVLGLKPAPDKKFLLAAFLRGINPSC